MAGAVTVTDADNVNDWPTTALVGVVRIVLVAPLPTWREAGAEVEAP